MVGLGVVEIVLMVEVEEVEEEEVVVVVFGMVVVVVEVVEVVLVVVASLPLDSHSPHLFLLWTLMGRECDYQSVVGMDVAFEDGHGIVS